MEQVPEQAPPELTAQPAVFRASISITRAATGKVEHYELIGTPVVADEQPKEPAP